MTLRLRQHFTTRTVLYAGALVLFWGPALALVGPGSAKFYSVYSQEQKGKEQKKQDEPLLRLESELVQIDVVVADKQGKLARDLKRVDFELFEDGKKQEITHFAIGTAAQPAKWLAVEKKKPAEKSPADSTPVEIQAGRYIEIGRASCRERGKTSGAIAASHKNR